MVRVVVTPLLANAMLDGFFHLNPTTLLWMSVGVVVTTVIVIIPGLGGIFALVMLMPIAFTLPQDAALGMLVASVAVSGTGNTITGVLFGVPGSASGVATILDGYPMAKKGEGTRAVTAGLMASLVGGVLGAIALAAILPFLVPIVLAFGNPEFFMLTFLALTFLAAVGQGSMLKGLVAGLFGLMLSFVGLEASTGGTRYVFGQIYLWSGIQLVPAMIGLFAISEMLELTRKGGSIATTQSPGSAMSQIVQGTKDVFIHWRVTVQSSMVGLIVGIAPGLGAAAAQFIAYSQAAKTSPRGHLFGTGVVEGVIAADAATNSKDGGAFIPTLALGIPGSSAMAILLVAMIGVGIQPGRNMLVDHADLVWMLIYILIIANIMAALMCISLSGWLAKVTFLNAPMLVPPVLILCLFGAYGTTNHWGDVITALVFGFIGVIFKAYGYSRATLIIGMVLGILLERHYLLSMRLFGLSFLQRPIVMGLIIFMVVTLFAKPVRMLVRRVAGRSRNSDEPASV